MYVRICHSIPRRCLVVKAQEELNRFAAMHEIDIILGMNGAQELLDLQFWTQMDEKASR